jgi:hypothetical protein
LGIFVQKRMIPSIRNECNAAPPVQVTASTYIDTEKLSSLVGAAMSSTSDGRGRGTGTFIDLYHLRSQRVSIRFLYSRTNLILDALHAINFALSLSLSLSDNYLLVTNGEYVLFLGAVSFKCQAAQ